MPRDLPLGNGSLLINYDAAYRIRDIFYPHVGMENHVCGHQCRLGLWVDGVFAWSDDACFTRSLRYEEDTLVTDVRLRSAHPNVALRITDAVDFAVPVLLRRFVVEPGGGKDVRLFLGHDLHIYGNAIGDTALYKPDIKAIVHYKDKRYFLIGGIGADGALDQFAVGQKEFGGNQGTWCDAEDGMLSGNPIAQGSVDSVIGLHFAGDPAQERIVYSWLALGKHSDDVHRLHERVRADPERFIGRTRDYWYLWANKDQTDFGPMPESLVGLYKRSLLTIRTQTDDGGGILAANDSDIQVFGADTYSYIWPRDGALVAFALDEAEFHELSRRFFAFCGQVIYRDGYFLHKYNPDGTLASSWHPYYVDGKSRLPIQEDETALVLWSLWHHFDRTRSIETIRDLYAKLIVPGGTFLRNYIDELDLCKPSYDLWEERWGVHAFTVGAVYGGLMGASNFARAFGEIEDADAFEQAAERLKAAVLKHFYAPDRNQFARMLRKDASGNFVPDFTVDAAIFGLLAFGMFSAEDAQISETFDALFERLWVKTEVGGCARYENDYYHQVSRDTATVPGNPWFICTLWRARYVIARAKTHEELEQAMPLLEWVCSRSLDSGILAEQVHPFADLPLSVSPLTWSHAEFVTAVLAYLDKLSTLSLCPTCGRPKYMREHERLLAQHMNLALLAPLRSEDASATSAG